MEDEGLDGAEDRLEVADQADWAAYPTLGKFYDYPWEELHWG
jgi:hypothetical protein